MKKQSVEERAEEKGVTVDALKAQMENRISKKQLSMMKLTIIESCFDMHHFFSKQELSVLSYFRPRY